MTKDYDIIICGAGPSGSACAIKLANSGLRVALIDKDTHPREKTCGDGLTLDTATQWALLHPDLPEAFQKIPTIKECDGLTLKALSGKNLRVPLRNDISKLQMYTVPRKDMDNMLLSQVKKMGHIEILENTHITHVEHFDKGIKATADNLTLTCRMWVGADGADTITRKKLHPYPVADKDKVIALRAYYSGVAWPEDPNFLQFYFNEKILPAYIWVFPMQNGWANVGLGILYSGFKKKKVNLKEILDNEIKNGMLKDNFKDAKPESKLLGHMIPLGRNKRPVSGQNYILTGDAAGLANPLSGEGIANALRSGRVAAEHLIKAFENNDFSATYNKRYDKEIYRRMGREFKNFRIMQNLCAYPRLVNYFIGKVGPYFINDFADPTLITKIQNKKWFGLRLFKYVIRKSLR